MTTTVNVKMDQLPRLSLWFWICHPIQAYWIMFLVREAFRQNRSASDHRTGAMSVASSTSSSADELCDLDLGFFPGCDLFEAVLGDVGDLDECQGAGNKAGLLQDQEAVGGSLVGARRAISVGSCQAAADDRA